jgi:hypothetical protein
MSLFRNCVSGRHAFVAVCGVVFAVVPYARAGSGDKARNSAEIDRISSIGAELAKLGDWEDQYAEIELTVDRLWEENGWTEEPDLFAKNLVCELAAIPPWEFARRMEHLSDAVSDRYEFTEEQTGEFQARVYGMFGSMLMREGRMVIRQTREVVESRVRNEPYTPEQVARWTEESDGLFKLARGQFDHLAAAMSKTMTPEQLEVYQRDMDSYKRRMKTVDEIRARWREGEWRPEDWGLESDPIYSQSAEAAGANGGANAPAGNPLDKTLESTDRYAYDETSWQTYVRLFIQRYKLDEAQAESALSILKELEARAADYRKLHQEELARVKPEDQEKTNVCQPIRKMFEELRRRLQPIPTKAQERVANDGAEVVPAR